MFVRKNPRQVMLIFTIAALTLAGCNVGATPAPTVDVNAINTAIVGTTVAQLSLQFTQTAQAQPTAAPALTDTPVNLPTFSLPTVSGGATPTTSGALPTISFNTTQVANTPVAGFTQLASPVPAGGATPVLGDACHNSSYIADVTVPDGTVFKPGVDFVKTWTIKNTGTCSWDEGYVFAWIAGDKALDPYSIKFQDKKDFISSGTSTDISVNLTAPLEPGKYTATWKMQSDTGYYFGSMFTVVIEVKKK
ncbi:MAG: NBR1-Ig-like domain-containing protein [Anaerolineales bacterium]